MLITPFLDFPLYFLGKIPFIYYKFLLIEGMQVKSMQRTNTLLSLNKKAVGKTTTKTTKGKEEDDK